ncbi:DUF6074 family protein [Mesorhizobium atlanticum]
MKRLGGHPVHVESTLSQLAESFPLFRIVANAIARLPNDEAAKLWRDTATHLLSVAIERGQSTNDARAEVRRFFDAVQSALRRLG